jgi:hypothetical protein
MSGKRSAEPAEHFPCFGHGHKRLFDDVYTKEVDFASVLDGRAMLGMPQKYAPLPARVVKPSPYAI